jgi:hypothetical protein
MALSVLDDGGEANGNLSMVARFSPPPVRGQPCAVNGPRAPRKPPAALVRNGSISYKA